VSTANALLVRACSDGESRELPGPSDRSFARMLLPLNTTERLTGLRWRALSRAQASDDTVRGMNERSE